jgi:predicted Zn-dependent peptidase
MSLENLGGSLDAYTSREHTAFQARVLDEHLVQAADVLFDLIFSPALREADLAPRAQGRARGDRDGG